MQTIIWRPDLEIEPIDPGDDYILPFDWSDKIGDDTIASATATVDDGATVAVYSIDSANDTVNVRIHSATAGGYPKITCSIETDGLPVQKFTRSVIIPVRAL